MKRTRKRAKKRKAPAKAPASAVPIPAPPMGSPHYPPPMRFMEPAPPSSKTGLSGAALEVVLMAAEKRLLDRVMAKLDDEGKQDLTYLLSKARPELLSFGVARPPAKPISRPSAKQLEALRFMHAFMGKHGYPPAHKEIAEALKVQRSSITMLLRPLAKKGYLTHGRRGEWALTGDAIRVLIG